MIQADLVFIDDTLQQAGFVKNDCSKDFGTKEQIIVKNYHRAVGMDIVGEVEVQFTNKPRIVFRFPRCLSTSFYLDELSREQFLEKARVV